MNYYSVEILRPQIESNDPFECPTCPYCNGQLDATPKFNKPAPFEFWRRIGEPKLAAVPVGASDRSEPGARAEEGADEDISSLPLRMLCRQRGAGLVYAPIMDTVMCAFGSKAEHSDATPNNASDANEKDEDGGESYRRKHFTTCVADRPLFVQLRGRDADTILAAARHIEDTCDAIDLDLDDQTSSARHGGWGAYLMEHWDLVHTIIHTLHVELKMICDAGASLIAVHGRPREQHEGPVVAPVPHAPADVDVLRRVQEHLGALIPILVKDSQTSSPGGDSLEDHVEQLVLATQCLGVVVAAEGLIK